MKNKINISKLIKEKFKDNTLEIQDLFEEIDLALDESYPNYEWKHDPTDIVKETDPGNARKIANAVNGNTVPIDNNICAPRNEIPGNLGRDPQVLPQVRPEKIAEVGGELSTARQRTINVPDLFSIITDPKKMSVGSPDRQLINNIMSNIGVQQVSTWREKVQKLQDYIYKLLTPSEQQTDITQVISALVFLNLFKKLAFFMDKPGKQFEYLFLPFFSPAAEVRGDESKEISDVVFGGKEYSLKFLHSSEPLVKGSYTNLLNKIKQNKYSMTLVARVFPAGYIEFAEFGVTTLHDLILKNYRMIGSQSETARALWFESNGEDASYPKFMCLLEPQRDKLSGVESGIDKTKLKQLSYNVGGFSFPEKNLPSVERLLRKAESNIKSKLPKDNQDAIELLNNTFQDFSKKPEQEKKSRKSVLEFIKLIQQEIVNQSRKIKVARGLQPSIQKESKEEPQISYGKFGFSVQGIWNTIRVEKLSVGNPETYNKQLGFVAGEISNFYVDMLESLEELNKNMTNYVATSSDTQRDTGSQTYAFKSMKNAHDIREKILKIESGKKKQ